MKSTEIKLIADHYGLEAQARQTMEECAELIVALNKYLRNHIGGQPLPKYVDTKIRNNVVEEIADVKIMLEQMIYLFDCEDETLRIAEEKINRTFSRDKSISQKRS